MKKLELFKYFKILVKSWFYFGFVVGVIGLILGIGLGYDIQLFKASITLILLYGTLGGTLWYLESK